MILEQEPNYSWLHNNIAAQRQREHKPNSINMLKGNPLFVFLILSMTIYDRVGCMSSWGKQQKKKKIGPRMRLTHICMASNLLLLRRRRVFVVSVSHNIILFLNNSFAILVLWFCYVCTQHFCHGTR